MFKKVAFTMYPITDVARARRFYEETLGLKREPRDVTMLDGQVALLTLAALAGARDVTG